jgi:hypothetical protein
MRRLQHGEYRQVLKDAGVEFTARDVFSDFWGTEYKFPTMKDARKAEKVTGIPVSGSNRKGHYGLNFTLY